MINTLLGMSLAGSAVFLLWRLTERALRGRLPARWSYRMLKAGIFFLLVPVGRLADLLLSLRPAPAAPVPVPPSIPVVHIPAATAPVIPAPSPMAPVPVPVPVETHPEIALSQTAFQLLAIVWAAGAAVSLLLSLRAYVRFRRRFLAGNRTPSSPEAVTAFQACRRSLGLLGRATLMENPAAASPFTTGLLRPVVVIPSNLNLTPEELRCLFLHELTHIRCGDLQVKFLSLLARCVHWFNPLVRLLNKRVQEVSEQSCDERAAVSMGQAERYAYGSVILKFASGGAAACPWAASLSTREAIERRLKRVLNVKKLKGRELALVLVLSAALLLGGTAAALAAREPLGEKPDPASDTKIDALNPSAASGGSGPASVGTGSGGSGPALAGAGSGGAGQPAGVPGDEPEEDASGQEDAAPAGPATYGNPSPETLAKIRAAFADKGATADTPILFGDAELIRSRGGILYRDDDINAYSYDYDEERIIKHFVIGNSPSLYGGGGLMSPEYIVGNAEAYLNTTVGHNMKKHLAELVDGEYPKNSKGETYGDDFLHSYVGYFPDLCHDHYSGDESEIGYLILEESCYYSVPYYPAAECPHEFPVPLYNEEHEEIGTFIHHCNGHYAEQGLSIEDVRNQLAGDRTEALMAEIRKGFAASGWGDLVTITDSTPVLYGDENLILSRGGTLLPDDDPASYTYNHDLNAICKCFIGKIVGDPDSGILLEECLVGNRERVKYPNQLDKLTEDGDYPKNSKGEPYGSITIAAFVGYYPDLQYMAEYPYEGRPAGYIRSSEMGSGSNLPEDQCPHTFTIPLYNSECEVIGEYKYGCGGHMSFIGMTVEEAKQALANLA